VRLGDVSRVGCSWVGQVGAAKGDREGPGGLHESPSGALPRTDGDGTVRLWDRPGKEIQRLTSGGGAVHVVAFSPDGSLLASGDYASVVLWDPVAGREVRRLAGKQPGVWSLAWSPDGKTLAVGGRDKTIQLWDSLAGKQLSVVGMQAAGGVLRLAWSADEKLPAATIEAVRAPPVAAPEL